MYKGVFLLVLEHATGVRFFPRHEKRSGADKPHVLNPTSLSLGYMQHRD